MGHFCGKTNIFRFRWKEVIVQVSSEKESNFIQFF